MLDIILNVFGIIFVILGYYISWSILLGKKVNFKNYRFYISLLVLIIVLTITNYGISKLMKLAAITLVLSLSVKYIFKIPTKSAFMTAFYVQLINLIDEVIFSIILVMVFNFDGNSYSILVVFLADIFVAILSIFWVKLKFVKKIYNNIIDVINKVSLKIFLLCLLPILVAFSVYLAIAYYKYNILYMIIANNIVVYLIFVIILILIKKERAYIKIHNKYNTTLNSLKEYEDILDRYRISNHENKNELLTIRNMLPKTNKKTISYIDKIIENKLKDNDKIMLETAKIPNGGLRGLIYSKVLLMKESNISYELEISKEVKTVDLINRIDDSTMLDICKIIGVYLDNAIQEVQKLHDKYVNVEMYLDKRILIIAISNNYEGQITLDKLDEKGYTSKGKGHGYGLTLAKEIIENNKKLSNERRLSKETFTQLLKIKM